MVSSKSMQNTLYVNDLVFINKVTANFKRNDIIIFLNSSNKKTDIIKRIIGLPNDVLQIKNTKIYINDKVINDLPNLTFDYTFFDTISNLNMIKNISNLELKNSKNFNFKKIISKQKIKNTNWTLDNFGPIWIPKKGKSIVINKNNYNIYKSIILNIESKNLDSIDILNKQYFFKQNYYFVLGDNRHHSRDSRYYGFISENQIQGKTILQ